jgi:hypothetical protein
VTVRETRFEVSKCRYQELLGVKSKINQHKLYHRCYSHTDIGYFVITFWALLREERMGCFCIKFQLGEISFHSMTPIKAFDNNDEKKTLSLVRRSDGSLCLTI